MSDFSISATSQKSEFMSRLARIEKGTGSSKSTLYVGVDGTVMASSRANAKLRKQALAAPAKRFGLLAILLSATFGAAALGLALYLRFAITGNAGPLDNSDLAMGINGGAALSMALFFGFILRMPPLRYALVAALGVLICMIGYHNLVHIYPAQFATMFSPTWVEQVVGATPANSIIWRGQTFIL